MFYVTGYAQSVYYSCLNATAHNPYLNASTITIAPTETVYNISYPAIQSSSPQTYLKCAGISKSKADGAFLDAKGLIIGLMIFMVGFTIFNKVREGKNANRDNKSGGDINAPTKT